MKEISQNLQVNQSAVSKEIPFADDCFIIQESWDELQCWIYKHNKICEGYNAKLSTNKTKITAFKGEEPVTSKPSIDN